MPIEIKELHIRVSVTVPGAGTAAAAGGGGAGGDDAREALVSDCVEQVLQILQNKMER